MERKIEKLPWAHLEWHLEAVAQFTRATTDFGDIDGQNKRVKTCRPSTLDQFERARTIAREIQLKPGVAFGHFDHSFHRCRGDGRDAEGHFAGGRKARQHQVGTRPGQVAHAHGRNAERPFGGLAEQPG